MVLNVTGLWKKYGNTEVLSNINLCINEGDFMVIMGTSGSGKSTLLYCVSGMDNPSAGDVWLCGKSINDMTEKQLEEMRGSRIGFIFQNANLVSNLSVRENVLISGYQSIKKRNVTEKQIKEDTELLLEKMGLTNVSNHLPSEISGGEAQRTAIARAVIKKPDIIFADEPTGALNRANTDEVLKVLDELHEEGQTILMVTHSKEAALHGDKIIYLEDGNIKSELNLADANVVTKEDKLGKWLGKLRW